MRYAEPLIATVVTNPTNRDLKYTWLGTNGMFVKAKSSVTVPFEVFTAANATQRPQLIQAIEAKMVKLEYRSRGVKCTQTDVVESRPVFGDAPKESAPEAVKTAPEPAPAPAGEPAEKRTQIINAVADASNPLKTGEDLVQKATGQKTVTVQEAMGWKKPETTDTRTKQEITDVKMEDALSENVGDPLARIAKAEAKKKADSEAAAKKKRSDAAKKGAASRKKKADK